MNDEGIIDITSIAHLGSQFHSNFFSIIKKSYELPSFNFVMRFEILESLSFSINLKYYNIDLNCRKFFSRPFNAPNIR